MEPVKITVNNNGSLKVEGNFILLDANGNAYDLKGRERISLCRCGLSQTKPFCDGRHREGFESTCVAYELAPPKA
jgi:CDGSH-type Zn-finger protein